MYFYKREIDINSRHVTILLQVLYIRMAGVCCAIYFRIIMMEDLQKTLTVHLLVLRQTAEQYPPTEQRFDK